MSAFSRVHVVPAASPKSTQPPGSTTRTRSWTSPCSGCGSLFMPESLTLARAPAVGLWPTTPFGHESVRCRGRSTSVAADGVVDLEAGPMTGRTAGAVLGWYSPRVDDARDLNGQVGHSVASTCRARRRVRRQLFASPVSVHGSAPTLSKYSASVICRPSTSTGACRAAATRASLGSAARSAAGSAS